jgi:hypothetical protein
LADIFFPPKKWLCSEASLVRLARLFPTRPGWLTSQEPPHRGPYCRKAVAGRTNNFLFLIFNDFFLRTSIFQQNGYFASPTVYFTSRAGGFLFKSKALEYFTNLIIYIDPKQHQSAIILMP